MLLCHGLESVLIRDRGCSMVTPQTLCGWLESLPVSTTLALHPTMCCAVESHLVCKTYSIRYDICDVCESRVSHKCCVFIFAVMCVCVICLFCNYTALINLPSQRNVMMSLTPSSVFFTPNEFTVC